MTLYKCDKCPEKYISISSAKRCCNNISKAIVSSFGIEEKQPRRKNLTYEQRIQASRDYYAKNKDMVLAKQREKDRERAKLKKQLKNE